MPELPASDTLKSDHVDQRDMFDYDVSIQDEYFLVDVPDDDAVWGRHNKVSDRGTALERLWGSPAYSEWRDDNVYGALPASWPCQPSIPRGDAAMLIARHAPGVAMISLPEDPEHRSFGLTLVESGDKITPEDHERVTSLRLAIAYVCCGQLPPTVLVQAGLQSAPDEDLPEPVADAFRVVLDRAKSSLDRALGNLSRGPVPAF